MKVLVTGGAGFVGTNLVKRLLKDGHDVYSLDNYSTGLKKNEVEGCCYFTGDIENIDHIWEDIDLVYHMAAVARIQPSFKQPEEYIRTNFSGTYAVVKYCIERGIPLVYAGSSSKHSGRYKNPYTFSKDLGEDIIKLYQQHYGLKASIARFYNVYGPHQLLKGGYRTLIGIWLDSWKNEKEFVIYGDGEQRRDFTHVDDIVDALVLIQDRQAYGYEFELGKGKNLSVNEVLELFNKPATYLPERPGEARVTLNTDTTAKEVLGWNPERDLKDYLKEELK